jgi:hypothetical protein
MATHKVTDKNGVHYLDDEEFKRHQRKGCMKSGCMWGAVILGVLFVLVCSIL